jgi:ATP synthase protein I
MTSDASNGSPEPPDPRGHRADDAWAASGLLIAGVAVWGGAGYLVSEWLDNQVFVMIGLLLGTATALYGIWFRYGKY